MGRFFFELRGEIDEEWVFADGSYVRAHQHASGARIGEDRAIGHSRGGPTTKIHISADACGNPINFKITGGEVHDVKVAKELIRHVSNGPGHFIADKGYDSDEVRENVRNAGKIPSIPRRSNSKKSNPEFDPYLYKFRHLVENLFAKIKHYRGIATRYDKLARNYKATIFLIFSLIWIKLGK